MGGSRFFDDNSERINAGDPSVLQNVFDGGGTVSAWTFLDAYVSNQRILSKNNSSGWLFYYRSGSETIDFFPVFPSGFYREETDAVISTGVWRYVSVTYNSDSTANRAVIYVNGEIEPSTAVANSASGTRVSDVGADFVIGNNQPLTGAMRGEISHAQAWNRILSVNEIIESMYKPGSIRSGLVGYWPCMGDSPERDLSGNGNTGAVTGATISREGPPISRFL